MASRMAQNAHSKKTRKKNLLPPTRHGNKAKSVSWNSASVETMASRMAQNAHSKKSRKKNLLPPTRHGNKAKSLSWNSASVETMASRMAQNARSKKTRKKNLLPPTRHGNAPVSTDAPFQLRDFAFYAFFCRYRSFSAGFGDEVQAQSPDFVQTAAPGKEGGSFFLMKKNAWLFLRCKKIMRRRETCSFFRSNCLFDIELTDFHQKSYPFATDPISNDENEKWKKTIFEIFSFPNNYFFDVLDFSHNWFLRSFLVFFNENSSCLLQSVLNKGKICLDFALILSFSRSFLSSVHVYSDQSLNAIFDSQ